MNADRNLLLGFLALQNNFIDRHQLIAAFDRWTCDKTRSLGRILLEHGELAPDTHALLEALVTKHIELHGDDPQQSLAAIQPSGSVRDDLRHLADADVESSLVHVSSAHCDADPYATQPWLGGLSLEKQRFRILRPHARGGLGEVYVAHDEELHREVALKEIQERYADHSESRARFLLEAEITGRLEHPGIVPVYSLNNYPDGRPFYAMRFIRGASLRDAISRFHDAGAADRDPRERSLELRKLLQRFIDVCNAAGYAHNRGVLHRDLKPANIMLGEHGETMVVDWGLAKVTSHTDLTGFATEPPLATGIGMTRNTRLGSALGTPGFMSPEQAAGQLDQIGSASDIYSLGATLYCLLAGQPPFDMENDTDVILEVQRRSESIGRPISDHERFDIAWPIIQAKIVAGDFSAPIVLVPHLSRGLNEICTRAMALDPIARYPSARALSDALERWLADEPISSWRASVSHFESLVQEYPDVAESREGLARHRVNLALVLSGLGQHAEAEHGLRDAIGDYEKAYSIAPSAHEYLGQIAHARLLLARVFADLGRPDDAAVARNAANADLQRLAAARASADDFRTNLASIYMSIGFTPDEAHHRTKDESSSDVTADRVANDGESSSGTLMTPPAPGTLPVSVTPTDDEPPKIEGRYKLAHQLAASGMAQIWVALDVDLNRDVILKYGTPDRSRSYPLFLREAQITAQLEHPGIPPIYGIGTRGNDGAPFISMRWVRGRTLGQAIGNRALPFDRFRIKPLIAAFASICRTINYAHSKGVVHCDPKPANIVLEDDGQAMLIDWGLAKLVGGARGLGRAEGIVKLASLEDELYQEGHVAGTPAYLSPEQARGAAALIDRRTDVFVLGATLFHVLTGHPPRRGGIDAVSEAINQHASFHPRHIDRQIPKALDAICARATAPRMDDRYGNAAQLADDVEKWLNRLGSRKWTMWPSRTTASIGRWFSKDQ